jgi:NhaP-type Na+/H+ and K+/H+ antiporter
VLLAYLLSGLAAAWVLKILLLQGLLLGSNVGSTDAAEVFPVRLADPTCSRLLGLLDAGQCSRRQLMTP